MDSENILIHSKQTLEKLLQIRKIQEIAISKLYVEIQELVLNQKNQDLLYSNVKSINSEIRESSLDLMNRNFTTNKSNQLNLNEINRISALIENSLHLSNLDSNFKYYLLQVFDEFKVKMGELISSLLNLLNSKIQKRLNFKPTHSIQPKNGIWDLNITLTLESHSLNPSISNIFSAISSKKTFKQIANTTLVDLNVRAMGLPFGEGTFRCAYYAIDDKETKFALKYFKNTGINEKVCADRTNKGYFLCNLVAAEFSKALDLIGINSTVKYVPCFSASVKQNQPVTIFSDKHLMLEPLLPSFQKWTNNEKFIADGSQGEIMSSFSHFSYVLSNKTFMISDNQGYTHKQGDKELFVLSDPAIHIMETGALPFLDELVHDVDGNRRKDGVKEFASCHRCGPICISLGLKPK